MATNVSVDLGSSRRERFGHRKEGTGRSASNRVFDIRGRRTGWLPPSDVKKDEEGFDDIKSFFGNAAPMPAIEEEEEVLPSKRIDFGKEVAKIPGASPAKPVDTRTFDYEVGGGYDDYMNTNDNDAAADDANNDSDDDITGFARKKGKAGRTKPTKQAKPAKEKTKAQKTESRERSKKVTVVAPSRAKGARTDGDDDDDDDNEILGADPYDRRRKSLGPLHPDGSSRYPARRRWQRLDHFKGERIKYTEEGAAYAEKLGVASPEVQAAYKRRTVSRSKSRDGGSRPRGGGSDAKSRSKRPRSPSTGSSGSSDEDSRRRSTSRSGHGKKPSKVSRSREDDDVGRASHRSRHASRDKSADRGRSRSGRRERSRSPVATKQPSAEVNKKLKQLVSEVRGTRYQDPLSPQRLPRDFREAPSPTLVVTPAEGAMYQIAVVRHYPQLVFEKLPANPSSNVEPAMAAAAFDAPPFISGTVRLKPGCAKAQESTYTCTQVFVAISCQPKALQVDISGQSYLLSPGDHFFVPDQTLYSMKNHSKDTDAEVAFVVIKPSGR